MVERKEWTFKEIGTHMGYSAQTARKKVLAGDFGDFDESGVQGCVIMPVDAIDVYIAELARDKRDKTKKRTDDKKDQRANLKKDDHSVTIFEHSIEDCEKEAHIQIKSWLKNHPEHFADKTDDEVTAMLVDKFSKVVAQASWTSKKKRLYDPENHFEIRRRLELPHDLFTWLTQKMRPEEAEFFILQYNAYMTRHDFQDPTLHFYIQQIIFEQIEMNRARTRSLANERGNMAALSRQLDASQTRLKTWHIMLKQLLDTRPPDDDEDEGGPHKPGEGFYEE